MNWYMVKKDLLRNKGIHFILLLFMILASCMAVVSVTTGIMTVTSIKQLYKVAQPPHFLQMHKGDLDEQEIEQFMQSQKNVEDWQICPMIDVYGEDIQVKNDSNVKTLAGCIIDISLVKQNERKDFLLDSNLDKIELNQGEIGIPMLLKEMYQIQMGDKIILHTPDGEKEFTVKTFLLDSMMNSSMCSSSRMLLSDEDFQKLYGHTGEIEYIVEAYFSHTSEAADFQTVYENAKLPQNGQAITYTMMFLLSALTDLITVFLLLIVSILMICIAFFCMRFTMNAALEEEISEIGIMKAIGLQLKDIRQIYSLKYNIMSAAGTLLGAILGFGVLNITTKHIRTMFGFSGVTLPMILFAILTIGLIYLLFIGYCKKLLKKIQKLTVTGALVRGEGFQKDKSRVKDGLHKVKKLPINIALSIREIIYQHRNWAIVFVVSILATFLVTLPIGVVSTLQNKNFVTYMGSTMDDILIEIDSGANQKEGYDKLNEVIKKQTDVEHCYEYQRICVQTLDKGNETFNLHVDCGAEAGNGLKYLSGGAPKSENEISISYLNEQKIGKTTGDTIMLKINQNSFHYKVSGVYQDVTSGGYTAKAGVALLQNDLPIENYSFAVKLSDPKKAVDRAKQWSLQVGAGVKIEPMEEFSHQTLGGVTSQLKKIIILIVVISLFLVGLIELLFLKLRLAKDMGEIAVLKAIGFTITDIKRQYLIKSGCVAVLGILIGVLLNCLLGENLMNVGLQLAGLGVKQVQLSANVGIEYVLLPIGLLGTILLAAMVALKKIKHYEIMTMMNE